MGALRLPSRAAFVGTSSGAATSEGAILNAYQNAIEAVASLCLQQSGDRSPRSREKARALVYFKSGVYDKHFIWQEGCWFQKWEERYRDSMRVYFRAFVLVHVPDDQFKKMIP